MLGSKFAVACNRYITYTVHCKVNVFVFKCVRFSFMHIDPMEGGYDTLFTASSSGVDGQSGKDMENTFYTLFCH